MDAPGAHVGPRGTSFRVHAPNARRVAVVPEGGSVEIAMTRDGRGAWHVDATDVRAGMLYRYRVDDALYPDPCSRFQPAGVHGASMIVDPSGYAWRDADWRGVSMHGQVVYELHIGSFTAEGTFDAAIGELEALREFGVTLIEIMPVAEFPGRCNWGYDGVGLFAPYHGYGDPHALRRFVDAAHGAGLGVLLDVVYNHLGPDGNYLAAYSGDYFSTRHRTEWGDALNFDGRDAAPVRDLFKRNAAYWIEEFHLDGLRLDATQSIFDDTKPHIIAEIVQAARAAASPRSIVVVGENEPQHVEALWPVERGGWGLDALWNDDFHHSAHVALTGRRDGYYHDHRGTAQEFVSAARHGFLFQGQRYQWQGKSRGTVVTDEPAASFVHFLENHDQVANTLKGARVRTCTSPGRYRALSALLLLGPQTPMLFMGQEFGASTPFMFFADHKPELAVAVHKGRREFMRQFPEMATPESQTTIRDPSDEATFRDSKLNLRERETHGEIYKLHRELLALRRTDPVLSRPCEETFDGATLSEHALLLRWFDAKHGDRLLIVNFSETVDDQPSPEPLMAPPIGMRWELRWSSEFPRYGGLGAAEPWSERGWAIPGESAALFVSVPVDSTASSTIRTGGRSG
jgi:maltooligosyltrehalose trehalohydrolase